MTKEPDSWDARRSRVREVISDVEWMTWLALGLLIILGFCAFVALAIVGLIYSLF